MPLGGLRGVDILVLQSLPRQLARTGLHPIVFVDRFTYLRQNDSAIFYKEAATEINIVEVAGVVLQVVVAIVVVAAFIWRIPSKDDLKRVEEKADYANRQNLEIRGDIKVLTEKVDRIEGYFDIPAP